jgi:hypothetical protein
MILRIERQYDQITTEFHNSDVDLQQIFDAFKGMLVATGWHPMTIDQHIIEMANVLKEDLNSGPY